MRNFDRQAPSLKVRHRVCTRSLSRAENICWLSGGSHFVCPYFLKHEIMTTLRLCGQLILSAGICVADTWKHMHATRDRYSCRQMFSRPPWRHDAAIADGYLLPIDHHSCSSLSAGRHSTAHPPLTPSISSSITTPLDEDLFIFLSYLHVFSILSQLYRFDFRQKRPTLKKFMALSAYVSR